MEKFPEDFDIRDELKLDKEVYKFTGNQFDLKQELQTDKAQEEIKAAAKKVSDQKEAAKVIKPEVKKLDKKTAVKNSVV